MKVAIMETLTLYVHLCSILFMAKIYEQAREAGLIDTYSADEAVGMTVQMLLFKKRLKFRDLARALHVSPATAGKRVRGELGWSVTDLIATAELLDVHVEDLIPKRKENQPASQGGDELASLVAGTGFEPVTSGL